VREITAYSRDQLIPCIGSHEHSTSGAASSGCDDIEQHRHASFGDDNDASIVTRSVANVAPTIFRSDVREVTAA
jgi:hypothetical protein